MGKKWGHSGKDSLVADLEAFGSRGHTVTEVPQPAVVMCT